jgi:hypothetical protein
MRPVRDVVLSTALVLAWLTAADRAAFAQPVSPERPETMPPAIYNPPPGGPMIALYEGESRLFRAPERVLRYTVANPNVCTLAPLLDQADDKFFQTFALHGLTRGVSQIVLGFNPSSGKAIDARTYRVVVLPDPDARKAELDQLAQFVRRQFPGIVQLEIEGIPGSPKVVVSGVVPDECVLGKVLQMIASDRIPDCAIVNKLVVSPPPVPPSCCPPAPRHRLLPW